MYSKICICRSIAVKPDPGGVCFASSYSSTVWEEAGALSTVDCIKKISLVAHMFNFPTPGWLLCCYASLVRPRASRSVATSWYSLKEVENLSAEPSWPMG
ncbi:hypothetical protein KCU88_g54, partial [Aureobasidium melanogenum]